METENKRFKTVLWCDDCTGEDDLGCFDGGIEVEYWDTLEEANKRYESIFKCGPWDGRIDELVNGEWVAVTPRDD